MRTPFIAAALIAAAGCYRVPSAEPDPRPGTVAIFGSMQGVVVDRTTNKGVRGTTVNLMPDESVSSAAVGVAAMTRDDGAFQIDRIVAGDYIVEVRARGYGVHRSRVRFGPGQSRSGLIYRLSAASVCPDAFPVKLGAKCP